VAANKWQAAGGAKLGDRCVIAGTELRFLSRGPTVLRAIAECEVVRAQAGVPVPRRMALCELDEPLAFRYRSRFC